MLEAIESRMADVERRLSAIESNQSLTWINPPNPAIFPMSPVTPQTPFWEYRPNQNPNTPTVICNGQMTC